MFTSCFILHLMHIMMLSEIAPDTLKQGFEICKWVAFVVWDVPFAIVMAHIYPDYEALKTSQFTHAV